MRIWEYGGRADESRGLRGKTAETSILWMVYRAYLTWVSCTSIVDFDSFLKVLNRPGGFRDPGEPEEYCRGFQVFDKDMTGFIGVGQLRYSKSFHSRSIYFFLLAFY